MRVALLAALATLIVGCTGPDLESDPAVELGTGEVAFESLQDGDALPLVSGLQGGRHIWGAVRVVGIDWREVSLVFTLEDEDGVQLTDTTTMFTELQACELDSPGCAQGMGELVGATILVTEEDAGAVVGGDVVLRVEAADAAGRTASTQRSVDVTFSLN